MKSTDNRKGAGLKTAKTVDISDLNELLHFHVPKRTRNADRGQYRFSAGGFWL